MFKLYFEIFNKFELLTSRSDAATCLRCDEICYVSLI